MMRESIQLLTCSLLLQTTGQIGKIWRQEDGKSERSGGLALPGSNQARKGRLVDALAVRGDEGRDTLR